MAIIVPEVEKIKEWATASGKDWEAAIRDQDADLKKLIMEEIASLGTLRKLNSLEKPKEIFIASEPFSVENDILTPTFKLKRNVGQKIYQAQIDTMYEELAKRGL